jgi:transcriptional regulator with XRE-family HTH domain
MNNMNIGKSIRVGLAYHGWGQQRLADEMGCKQSNVSMWSRADENLHLSTVSKLAQAMGYSVSEFIALGEK